MNEHLERLTGGRHGPAPRGFAGWLHGRARRREYWLWAAPWLIATFVVSTAKPGLEIVFAPLMLLACIRRLHDLGVRGWGAVAVYAAIRIAIEVQGALSSGGRDGFWFGLVTGGLVIALGAIPGQRTHNAFGAPPGVTAKDVAETFS